MIPFTEVKHKERDSGTSSGIHYYTEVWWKDCLQEAREYQEFAQKLADTYENF